ncbi:MAG TPA: DUF4394 domain-containing protein [Chthoniobacterales bacterium]|jgi:hypothetical protein|nr:DUF4394 domain-containing protein [Chthoniobacterales bacterium]
MVSLSSFGMRVNVICRVSTVVVALIVSCILSARAETLVALMTDKTLRYFDSESPGAWLKTINITGIPGSRFVQAFDYRPDGTLVIIARENDSLFYYNVDPVTGVAATSQAGVSPSNLNAVAFDSFASNVHQADLVLSTDDDIMRRFYYFQGSSGGTELKSLAYDNVANDGDPADVHSGANPNIVALGSTNGFPSARSAVLYGIDAGQDSLVIVDWDTGVMDTVAGLFTQGGGIDVGARTGFDISGVTGTAYLSYGLSTATTLATVNLTTGRTTIVGTIGPAGQPSGVLVADISALPASHVANISTRGRVGTGEDQMIAGFIIQGGASNRLIVRGLGPSLGPLGVNNFLPDPVLTVFDGNGVQIATNDNWKSNQQSEITQTGLAPSNDLEAAVTGTVPPGLYTAIVSDKNGATGVGLVEIYKLPDL